MSSPFTPDQLADLSAQIDQQLAQLQDMWRGKRFATRRVNALQQAVLQQQLLLKNTCYLDIPFVGPRRRCGLTKLPINPDDPANKTAYI